MNPPQWNCLICCDVRHLIPLVLWKNSVSAAFYAVFFTKRVQKGTKIACFAIALLRSGPAKQVWGPLNPSERPTSVALRQCHNGGWRPYS
jgi:hypothetical protein